MGSLAGVVVPAGINWDFGNFYDAGRRVAAGEIGDLFAIRTPVAGGAPQGRTGFWGTPISAYLYVVLAPLPPLWAMLLFKLETAVFNLGALWLLYRSGTRFLPAGPEPAARYAAAFSAASLLFQPIWTAFRTGGQTTPSVFFCFALAVVAILEGHAFRAMLAIAAAALIKPSLITAVAFFTLVGYRRYLRHALVIFGAVGVLSLALMGFGIHEEFLRLMLRGLGKSVSWPYNSGLYVTFENLKLDNVTAEWPRRYAPVLDALRSALKIVVVALFAAIVYRSRARHWTPRARDHFNLSMAICFFLLFGHIVYEAYLTVLFVVLAYLIASEDRLGAGARRLVAWIVLLCVFQNITWIQLLEPFERFDGALELIAIGLFKSAPLILLLLLLSRHQRELLDSYEAPAWRDADGAAAAS